MAARGIADHAFVDRSEIRHGADLDGFQIGGLPSLTAVLVILTGIGTARAVQVNEAAGAFAGLAMGLNALLTAILFSLLRRLLM
jgi:putative effector of murein hydrolase